MRKCLHTAEPTHPRCVPLPSFALSNHPPTALLISLLLKQFQQITYSVKFFRRDDANVNFTTYLIYEPRFSVW
jgi:hypothetical protein